MTDGTPPRATDRSREVFSRIYRENAWGSGVGDGEFNSGSGSHDAALASAYVESVRQFMYGMAGLEIRQHLVVMRASLDNLFMAITFGDMLGLPIIPPFYTLRLLPYIVPSVETWKRRVMRERDLTEDHDYDLHGV